MTNRLTPVRHPAVAYAAPFAVLVALLAAGPHLSLGRWEYPVKLLVAGAALWFFSRGVIDLRARSVFGSIGMGIGVFAVWVAPQALWPDYRSHWLFQNAITGSVASTLSETGRSDPVVLVFRIAQAAILVPVIEELFWRGWLMRWLIRSDFETVTLGTYTTRSFWITALLFACEHGPYWDVGLLAGIAYNSWLVRTRTLGDCMLAHAVTNAALSAFVLITGNWEYWL